MATTTLIIEEKKVDREFLRKNHYNVQVSKGVSTPGGAAEFNVVYHSQTLAPSMAVAWTPKYALNWTTSIPNKGAKVTYLGKWQKCDLGQSYNLTADGDWEINNNDTHKDPHSLNIGKNKYSQAVNIIVGIAEGHSDKWQPFYIGPNKLAVGASGHLQPRDKVQIWFAEGIVTGTMIAAQSTEVEEFDMTKIAKQYFWLDTTTGTWQNSPNTFDH